ncbi:MAG: citrate/2-methylcitrate synthase, partial [Candidatus Thermochlorobacter sp.]
MSEQFVPGLENVPAVKTKVSALDVVKEKIIIRGYDLIELAQSVSYLDVAHLLIYEHLPSASEASAFAETMRHKMHIPDEMYEIFKVLPKGMDAMDLLRTGLSILSGYEDHALLHDNSKAANIQKGISILAKAPAIMVNAYRANRDLPIVKPDVSLSFSENFLYMIQGTKPDAETTKMFDLILTCYIDHELPNSTFTARVIASTLSDMYGAIVGAVASLKGPLHGGANEACVHMILEVLENGGSAKAEEI